MKRRACAGGRGAEAARTEDEEREAGDGHRDLEARRRAEAAHEERGAEVREQRDRAEAPAEAEVQGRRDCAELRSRIAQRAHVNAMNIATPFSTGPASWAAGAVISASAFAERYSPAPIDSASASTVEMPITSVSAIVVSCEPAAAARSANVVRMPSIPPKTMPRTWRCSSESGGAPPASKAPWCGVHSRRAAPRSGSRGRRGAGRLVGATTAPRSPLATAAAAKARSRARVMSKR